MKDTILLKLILVAYLVILLMTVISCKKVKKQTIVSSGSVEAAEQLTERIIPKHAKYFIFEEISKNDGNDVFEIESYKGKVIIRGNNGVSMAMGLNWYLKEYCKCSVSLRGSNLNLPSKLPAVDGVQRKVSWAKHRYFLNYCAFGYSMPWMDWNQWERLIDYMALNGVNTPLAITGQEATWQSVCRRLELSDEHVRNFLAGPPYLPFGWMGCLDGWGGPLSQNWIDSHEELGRKILARERELGMTPVLQGFTGHVPAALTEKYPNAKMHTINWADWTTHLLDPLDPLFPKIANLFMEEQTKHFGTDNLYGADTFIEMEPPSGELGYLHDLSKAIYKGMSQYDPKAVWVFQTWAFKHQKKFWSQPRIQAFFDAIQDEQMLCLDLFCETYPIWNQTQSFYGKPWLWCNIQNFGNKVFLGGKLNKINNGIIEVKQDSTRGKLRGLGLVNEGLGYNPVIHDLMFEMAWQDKDIDLDAWIRRYTIYRYGEQNSDAEKAWKILKETVYSKGYPSLTVLTDFPSLKPQDEVFYDDFSLTDALNHMLNASSQLGNIDTYRFDLINLARQVLSNHSNKLHNKIIKAYKEKDTIAFKTLSDEFLQLILDIDELVGTREEFLLGKNLEDAKRWGITSQETRVLEWNARRILTLWGKTSLNGYARKEWSGLLSGYYYTCWDKFLNELNKELTTGETFNEAKFNDELREWMENWSNGTEVYPNENKGESVLVAIKLWDKYCKTFN